MACCVNCSTLVVGHSEFCSRRCSDQYWTMDIETVIAENKAKETIMAKKTEVLVTLVDDITGTEFTEGEGETVRYSLDGQRYEIDLMTKNAAAFRKAFEKYTKASRMVGARTVASEPSEATAIRTWAKEHGKDVNDRGRIPTALVEEYRAAQK